MLATVRADGWQQIMAGNHGVLPAVTAGQPLTRTTGDDHEAARVMVIRVDAAIIEARHGEAEVTGHYKAARTVDR